MFFLFFCFIQNFFARNFYNMRLLSLFVAFAINFILLFYKVSVLVKGVCCIISIAAQFYSYIYTSFIFFLSLQVASLPASNEEEGVIAAVNIENLTSDDEDESQGRVYFVLEEDSGYMEPSLHFLAVVHTIISFCCIIGYYCLKV